jgi:hypothetical protein
MKNQSDVVHQELIAYDSMSVPCKVPTGPQDLEILENLDLYVQAVDLEVTR